MAGTYYGIENIVISLQAKKAVLYSNGFVLEIIFIRIIHFDLLTIDNASSYITY